MALVKGIAGKTLVKKLLILVGKQKSYDVVSVGIEGERKVGKVLQQLPEGWRVWHDLNIDGENIDHLVASAKGVFIIEVKNYSGSVLATPKGLYTHGYKKPNYKVTSQVWRQVYKLRKHLPGQFINPILVFLDEVKGDKAKGVPCLQIDDLLGYLRSQQNVLTYERSRGFFEILDLLVK